MPYGPKQKQVMPVAFRSLRRDGRWWPTGGSVRFWAAIGCGRRPATGGVSRRVVDGGLSLDRWGRSRCCRAAGYGCPSRPSPGHELAVVDTRPEAFVIGALGLVEPGRALGLGVA